MTPLKGLRVLDFSTLLPGPIASLLLAEAGADVLKIEHPDGGDAMRTMPGQNAAFALLNRGKRSLAIDLKQPDALTRLRPLLASADVLIEQFRPGVMARLGLNYDNIKAINPRLIYCSISGYGQYGPKCDQAGHDLNYLAMSGMLTLTAEPTIPPALIADIAGGAYPAVINILLALRERDQTGQGCFLDIAMSEHVLPFMFWALGAGQATRHWPQPGQELLTGGSPRYQIYRTQDDKYLATAALEQKFWDTFCALIDLPTELRDDSQNPAATLAAVQTLIEQQPAAYWQEQFRGHDVCCNIVQSVQKAMQDPQFQARKVFQHTLTLTSDQTIAALPIPIARQFRNQQNHLSAPELDSAEPRWLDE